MRLVRCLAVLLAVALGGPASVAGEQRQPSLFGTSEAFSSDNSAFFKWTGVLARFEAEQRHAARNCSAADPSPRAHPSTRARPSPSAHPSPSAQDCPPAQWLALVAELAGLEPRDMLDRVNTVINRHSYVPSQRNWGESNYWETPFEFLRKSGQCQDYAVAKYLLLRAAGMPADQLRVVVLRDETLGLDHAVTVAYVGGEALLLDNQIRNVVPAAGVLHYRPYYSINEQGWWLHRGARARYAAVN
jgi:predicted transglutaminase-like cysteine proteinase